MQTTVKPNDPTRFDATPSDKCGGRCFIIYSMLLASHQCQVVHVGELTGDKFKKCTVRVVTKELRDEVTNEVIRQSGTFDAVVIGPNDNQYNQLKGLLPKGEFPQADYAPCTFMLRGFTFKDKKTNEERLGTELQLKRWWR